MADEHGGGGGGGGGILIALFLIVLVSWLMAGAGHRLPLSTIFTTPSPFASSTSKNFFAVFKFPQAPTLPMPGGNGGTIVNAGQNVSITDDYESDIVNVPTYTGGISGSPYQESVQITGIYGAQLSAPSQEYLVLTANPRNRNPVVITGWRIESRTTGRGAAIPGGIENPVSGATEAQGPIVLNPGDSAIVSTGRAPIGASFRENLCTGYFGKFQPFTPPLKNYCPSPAGELAAYGGSLRQEQACLAATEQLSACTTVTSAPIGVSSQCTQFLETHESYNGCLATHENDPNFELPIWRVYLGSDQELWSNSHDYLELVDQDGNLVSSASY